MSFDLAVRPESPAMTAEEATRKYLELTALEPGALPAGPRAVAFYRELTARYPDSPWSADLTLLGDAVVMSMGWSTPDAVVVFIRELAERRRLVLYDPQDGAVYSPPSSRGEPAPVLSSCDGSRVENPGPAQLEATVERLSAANWFALEHREGLPDRHFRAEVEDRSRIVRAFTGFAAGDDSWRQEFDWQRMEF